MQRYYLTSVRQAMKPEMLRPLQIITIGLAAGPGAFLGIILFFLVQPGPAGQASAPFDNFLMVGGILFLATAALSFLLFPFSIKNSGKVLQGETQERPASDVAATLVANYSVAWIIRCALQEGAALFGLVILFLAVQTGAIADTKIWAAVIPYVFFLANVVSLFPSEDRILSTYRTNLPDTFV